MKQYEIRTKDLEKIVATSGQDDESAARKWFNSCHPNEGVVLVYREFETEAEADKARLDWLQNNPSEYVNPSFDWQTGEFMDQWHLDTGYSYPTVREAIDVARKAPQPKVTVIAAPEVVA